MGRWTNLAAGLTVGLLLSVAFYVVAAPTGVPEPARIGVVDFSRFLNSYDKMKDADATFMATQKTLGDEAKKRATDIQQLEATLAMHTPGSDAYAKTEKEILQKKAEYDTWSKMNTAELLDHERDVVRSLYLDVEKASADYARANRLTLVLKTDKADLSATSIQDLHLLLKMKQVLYYSPDVDITDAVVAALNADYHRKTSGIPKGAPK
jgi:Skp family chaperone for outer membrane proteins